MKRRGRRFSGQPHKTMRTSFFLSTPLSYFFRSPQAIFFIPYHFPYHSRIVPVSFSYRDTGMFWEAIDKYSGYDKQTINWHLPERAGAKKPLFQS